MKTMICQQCGAQSFIKKNGVYVCEYCDTKYVRETVDSQISLSDDVAQLLAKCKSDPRNARKYANLILDIDPDNEYAHIILFGE